MINKLRELMDHVVICIDIDDSESAMLAIAQFTLLFEDFLRQNKEYIFDREIAALNRRLIQMMRCMEHNDLRGLKETINLNFRTFLDGWDFDNSPLN